MWWYVHDSGMARAIAPRGLTVVMVKGSGLHVYTVAKIAEIARLR